MKTVDLMNVLAHASRSKTNRDLAIMAGLGIFLIGGICIYCYMQNQELKLRDKKNLSQMSDLSSQLLTMQEKMINMQFAYDEIFKKNNDLLESIRIAESKKSNKDEENQA